jgi:hypothetical protein
MKDKIELFQLLEKGRIKYYTNCIHYQYADHQYIDLFIQLYIQVKYIQALC